ncbi:hypothetical protein PG989_016205 [Apiospora arundinis]
MGDDRNNADFYRPLDIESVEFRLLLLQAGEGDEPVKCQLVHASLKDGATDRPPYETISYCWGDASLTDTIFLDGLEMVVPLSSATVLRRMRKPTEERTLWIDAICINQNDIDERGQQVALMKEIYSKTAQNLIWLGEGDEDVTWYCEFVLDTAYSYAERETNNFADFDEIACKTLPTSGLKFPLLKHKLVKFFSSPWFERVWIIQEALLAPKGLVHVGSHEMDFKKLLLSATWLVHLSPLINFRPFNEYIGLLNCHRMYDLGHRTEDKSMEPILEKILTFQATNPRDYVYGVLGLYQDIAGLEGPLPDLLTPDYNKPVSAVMRDASRYIIEQSANLDFLRLIRHREETAYELTGVPSWAEPWHLNNSKLKCAANMKYTLYSADNAVGKREAPSIKAGAAAAAATSSDPDVLSLTGIIVDKVKDTTGIIDGDPEKFADLLKSPDSPIYIDAVRADPVTIGFALIAEGTTVWERPTAEFACTNVLAWAAFVHKHKDRPRYVNMSFGPVNPYTRPLLGAKPDLTADEWDAVVDYDNAMTAATQDRRIFRTEGGGNVGLGPRDMVPGDVVAVLYGCRWPVILRPREGKDGDTEVYYEFIEVCYVHGLMDGEAVLKHEASGEDDMVFHLR